jgi:hypothetical protein
MVFSVGKIDVQHNAVNSRDPPHRFLALDYARCIVRHISLRPDRLCSLRQLFDHLGTRSRGHLTSNTGHCDRIPIL